MIVYPSVRTRLKNQHESVSLLIAQIDPQRLHNRPSEGKWNIQEHIAHLGRYQSVFAERLNRMLREDVPAFERYSAEQDPEFELYRSIDTYTLLQQLGYERELLYKRLSKLKDPDMDRKGRHPVFGEMTVLQWTEFFLLHEAHHLFTIFKLANTPETTTAHST